MRLIDDQTTTSHTCIDLNSGSSRMRFPVSANTAFAMAGATGGTPGSPTPPGGALALHELDVDPPRRFVDPHDASPSRKFVLLDRAALHRDAAVQREAHPEDDRALHLRAHAVRVDDRAGVDRHPRLVDADRPVRALHDRGDHGRVGEEAAVRGEAERAAVLRALAPARRAR